MGARTPSSEMYAVIKAGGQQLRVTQNQTVTINRIAGDVGSKVTFDQVLMVGEGEETAIGTPLVAGAKVEAEIVRQKRGPKLNAFNYKPKKNVRKRWGHRQELTELRITKISAGK